MTPNHRWKERSLSSPCWWRNSFLWAIKAPCPQWNLLLITHSIFSIRINWEISHCHLLNTQVLGLKEEKLGGTSRMYRSYLARHWKSKNKEQQTQQAWRAGSKASVSSWAVWNRTILQKSLPVIPLQREPFPARASGLLCMLTPPWAKYLYNTSRP